MIAYADLLELVLERNPFHQARLAGWDRGSAPPPLTQSELVADQAARPPFGTNLTYDLDRYVAMHQTSGTTGPPLRVLDTAEDWAWWRACLARTFQAIESAPATAWRSRSRSARTSTSGRPRRGSKRSRRWRWPAAA